MRRLLTPVVCWVALLAGVTACAPVASAGWRDWVSPRKNWERLKDCCRSSRDKAVGYCEKKVNRARAEQRKLWGLKLPPGYDDRRPLAVLVHGLDSAPGVWGGIASRLEGAGIQAAYFNYPSDGPIEKAAALLADELAAFHAAHPRARVDIVAHSMGALVARDYIEGPRYAGAHPVGRFIAIAPPNHGSCWARGRFALEFHEQYWLWRTQPGWSPVWAFTDGHGEAGAQLRPGSDYLEALNARPRRPGVRYTIIAGNQHNCSRMTANAVEQMTGWTGSKRWWGLRQARAGLERVERYYRCQTGDGDGVVTVESARLEGVSDVVVLPADHNTLAMSFGGRPPAAWEVVRERLGR